MFYTIYKITNKINNKIYIGKHQTLDLDDDYMGSGKLIRAAIEKYGLDNFEKEILHVFDNEDDMNSKESELITDKFVMEDTNYNLCPGGQGGWGYIKNHERSKDWVVKGGKTTGNLNKKKYISDPAFKMTVLENFSKGREYADVARRKKFPNGTFFGKTHSEETKIMMSQKAKLRTGSKNSQYGTMWITNGSENKKIKKTEPIPEGYWKGRK